METTYLEENIWPTHVTVGDIVYPPNSVFGPRIQPFLQLVFVHTGEVTLHLDKVQHIIPANSAFILFPGHEEHFQFARHTETYHSWLHLDIPTLAPSFLTQLQSLPWPIPLSPTLSQLMHDALQLRHSSFPAAQQMLKALLLQLLWCYIGEAEQHRKNTHAYYHPAVDLAQQFIHQHLDSELTLDTISTAAMVSPPHLIRLFRSQLHTTPISFVWQCRVAKGIELLEQTGLSVGHIALRCGFQSRYHFSRRIRESTNLTPLQIRHRSWHRSPK